MKNINLEGEFHYHSFLAQEEREARQALFFATECREEDRSDYYSLLIQDYIESEEERFAEELRDHKLDKLVDQYDSGEKGNLEAIHALGFKHIDEHFSPTKDILGDKGKAEEDDCNWIIVE